jgi:MFS transporter, DHA1 family, inner membrane transport protein
MPFFRNSAVNLLNLHYGINTVALAGADAFFLIYLLNTGIPIPGVLLSFAVILLCRFAIRPLVVPLGIRFGLRPLVVAGTLLTALTYPLLALVHGAGMALAALIITAALGTTLYWTAYHAWYARLGDDEHRGQQVGVREAAAAMVGVVSPVLTGWMLVTFGPLAAFGTTALVAASSTLPLFWAQTETVPRHAPGMVRVARPAILLFLADGSIAAGNLFVWQIALFLSLNKSFLGYGGALALAALIGAVGSMALGRHIDAGHGRRAVGYAASILALMVLLRAAAVGHATLAVLANALQSLGYCLFIPTIMTPIYAMAKRSACPLRFQVAAEGGWDIGGAATLLIAAAAISIHLPLSAGIMLALPGVAAIAVLLPRYYGLMPAIAAEQCD